MENGLEILEQAFGIFVFVAALTLLFRYCSVWNSLNEEVKEVIYFNHTLYMEEE